MIGYAALRWSTDDAEASADAERARGRLTKLGWRLAIEQPGWCVSASPPDAEGAVREFADGAGVLLGTSFHRSASDRGVASPGRIPETGADFKTFCKALASTTWGSYVAILADPSDSERLEIFRDPIGAVDCATWHRRGLRIVTSAPEVLISLTPPLSLAVDWARVAELLVHPGSVGEALPFVGVNTVQPGTWSRFARQGHDCSTLWTPSLFCRPSRSHDRAAALAAVVDSCVAAWCSRVSNGVAELSGGLDSAIVAAASAATERTAVRRWFHYYTDDRQGDERAFATAVAAELVLPLTTVPRTERQLDPASLGTMPITMRPGLGSVSLFHDRDLAERAATLEAPYLVTGQGGDAVFFQPATPLIATELWSDPATLGEKLSIAIDLAEWTKSSIWTLLTTALRDRYRRTRLPIPGNRIPFLNRSVRRGPYPCRWLDDIAHLPPAKQMQVWMLANSRSAFGPSWCSKVCRLIHPLLSQPIVEHVLAIPVMELTRGRRDRALARQAFAGRLPPSLLERKGKGDLTHYFGRMLAASAAFLRPYLLDGVLSEQKILDRTALEPVLSPEYLMQHDHYSDLITTIIMEQWARTWTSRLNMPNRSDSLAWH